MDQIRQTNLSDVNNKECSSNKISLEDVSKHFSKNPKWGNFTYDSPSLKETDKFYRTDKMNLLNPLERIELFIRDNNLFIEVMNQAVQLDALADDVFGSEAMGLKITFDIENGTMEFKQGPYNIKLNKE